MAKCTCGYEAPPACISCGEQGSFDEDPIDSLTSFQRFRLGRWKEGKLDSMVHDAALSSATNANSSGTEAQVRFLLQQGCKFEDIVKGQ